MSDKKINVHELIEEVKESMSRDDWYKLIAETCIEHMKYIEYMEAHNPQGLTVDDYGLLEIERGFLTLYAEKTKGGLPTHDSKKH